MRFAVISSVQGIYYCLHTDSQLVAMDTAKCLSRHYKGIPFEVWNGATKLATYTNGKVFIG